MESPTQTKLSVDLVTDRAGLAALASDWRDLAAGSRYATVFQTYEWNAAWWRHFGGRPRLQIYTFRDSGALVGILPLVRSRWYRGAFQRLSFLGTGGSDYLDIIVADSRLHDVVASASAALQDDRSWHILDLQQLRDGGAFRTAGMPNVVRRSFIGEACPYVELPSDWPAFLRTLGKKTRANVGYYERNIDRLFEVRMEIVQDAADLDPALQALYELHQRRWNKRWLPGVFGSERVRAFHKQVARDLLAAGALRLLTIRLDGEIQAALYCYSFGDRFCYYQGGFEPTLARHSLGTVATAVEIRRAIEEGKTVFDFLRGDEPYKAKWAAKTVNNERWIGWRPGLIGPLVGATASVEQRAEMAAKRAVQRIR